MNKIGGQFNLFNYTSIIIGSCLFLTLIFGVILIWPKLCDLRSIQEKIKQKEEEFQYVEDYSAKLYQVKEKLKEHKESFDKIDSSLPNESDLPSLLNFVQKASSQSGLVLKKISPTTQDKKSKQAIGGIKESEVSLNLGGFYSSLKEFIYILENSARLIEVELISFNSPKNEESPFDFNLTINFRSY